MASKRRPIRTQPTASSQNFRPCGPEINRQDAKGTRPTANPTSIKEALLLMILHLCKKSIFFNINIKVALYLGSLFLISLFGDFVPYPKSYFSRSDNLFNVYFVKWGWAWTLMLSVPYLFMVHFTLCCGDFKKLLKNHFPRIVIATGFWFIWTKLFNIIETSYGRCTVRTFDSKQNCIKAGHFWQGFDISGHAFILIYSSLVLIEEARPIMKWETLKDYIRNELYNRSVQEYSSSNPLRNLTDEQMKELNFLYEKFTPAIRGLFIAITFLQILWDVMLVCTMMYYHKMAEKVISGIFAILTWFFTYRAWYQSTELLPDQAGKGSFVLILNQRPNSTVGGLTTTGTYKNRKQSLTPPSRNVNGTSSQSGAQKYSNVPLYQQNQRSQQSPLIRDGNESA